MSFAILRVAKLKSLQQVGRAATHNLRATSGAAPHADPARRGRNRVELGASDVAGVMAAVEARLARVPPFRRDAVRAVELVLTTSPEFFATRPPADWEAWAEASLAWLRDTWGADNVVSCALHMDETTPHLQALVVPVHDGRLRAAHWLDGPAKLSAMQTSYAAAVESLQLRRGVRRSEARHVPLKAFYALAKRIADAVKGVRSKHRPPRLPERGVLGRVSAEDWAQLQADLATYGAEGLRLRSEAVAARLMASSEVGEEAQRRADLAAQRAAEAEAHLADLVQRTAEAQAQLATVQATTARGMATVRELAHQVQALREQLQLPQLEAERDALRVELTALQRLRSDYDR